MTLLKLRINELHFDSVREFEDLKLDFRGGVNVMQVRNGYGKSTILEMLRWMFTGQIGDRKDWPRYKRKPTTAGHDNRDTSCVTLEMEIEDVNDEMIPWTLKMHFDHANGRAWFETDSPGIGGNEDEWKLPPNFRAKFYNKPNFTELFLFDGEKAKELAKSQDHEQIEGSIRELTGLRSIYQHVESGGFLDQDRTSHFADYKITDPDNAYSKWADWADDLSMHMEVVERNRTRLTRDISKLKKSIESAEKKEQEIGVQQNVGAEIGKLNKKKRDVKTELTEETSDLLIALGNPANVTEIWTEVQKFHAQLQDAKIPEGVGRQFFKEIVDEDQCICGREMDEPSIAAIGERSERYLGEEVLAVVKSMQRRVGESEPSEVSIGDRRAKIIELQGELVSLDSELTTIATGFDEDAQKTLDELKEKIKEDTKSRKKKINERQEISEQDPAIITKKGWDDHGIGSDGSPLIQPARFKKCKNLFTLRKVEKALNDKLAVSKPLQQMNDATDIVKSIYEEALENVLRRLRKQLQERTQDLFDQIPGTGGGLKIRLDSNGFKFLDDFDVEQTTANQGGVLCAAYCFISAMAELGSVDVPLVADSPITGMENLTAEGWTTTIWPMFKQSIFIATPGEKLLIDAGPEGEARAKLYSDEVRRITVYRSDENLKGKPQKGIMTASTDDDWFRKYAAGPADKGGD